MTLIERPPPQDEHARFTPVPLKTLSDQKCGKLFYFDNFSIVSEGRNARVTFEKKPQMKKQFSKTKNVEI